MARRVNRRTIGQHFGAAEAISQFLEETEIKRGATFRPLSSSRSQTLGDDQLSEAAMHHTATVTGGGVGIRKVQVLLGYRHIKTTQN